MCLVNMISHFNSASYLSFCPLSSFSLSIEISISFLEARKNFDLQWVELAAHSYAIHTKAIGIKSTLLPSLWHAVMTFGCKKQFAHIQTALCYWYNVMALLVAVYIYKWLLKKSMIALHLKKIINTWGMFFFSFPLPLPSTTQSACETFAFPLLFTSIKKNIWPCSVEGSNHTMYK